MSSLDLGRFWQAVKFAGILFWLVLMLRGTVNAFKQPGDKTLLALFFASVIAIGLFLARHYSTASTLTFL